ncbi:1-(5-phosphoribosyl)-5-[(5-phosphoribosylamino)methylideneamino] imidazole-4-carboxamide isomerase, partial [Lacticaseibacillus rhamnosus MTCC 5462]
ASGGVHTLADLTALQTAGIQAAVIGKAWQTGSFPLNKLKNWRTTMLTNALFHALMLTKDASKKGFILSSLRMSATR